MIALLLLSTVYAQDEIGIALKKVNEAYQEIKSMGQIPYCQGKEPETIQRIAAALGASTNPTGGWFLPKAHAELSKIQELGRKNGKLLPIADFVGASSIFFGEIGPEEKSLLLAVLEAEKENPDFKIFVPSTTVVLPDPLLKPFVDTKKLIPVSFPAHAMLPWARDISPIFAKDRSGGLHAVHVLNLQAHF